MTIGVSLQLFNGSTPQVSLTGIQALWWDVTEPKDAGKPVGRSVGVTTDTNGYISLDLSYVSGLTVGDYGFLMLYKKDEVDYTNSLVFSGKVQTSTVASGVNMQPITTSGAWVRNPSWLPLPAVASTEQKVVGLYCINKESNFIAFTVAGSYTVNWGDGITENFATGSTAYHQYDWSDTDLDGTNAPVAFTDTGDLIGRTSHGYGNGDKVQFYDIVGTTGLVASQTYYVVNATSDTFQVSATPGGSPLPLTTDGSANLLNYKQAVVTITPQAANDLTSLNFNVRHTATAVSYAAGWMDILVSGPLLSVLVVSAATQNIGWGQLKQFQLISTSNITSFSYIFNSCTAITSIPLLNTATGVDFTAMFYNCTSITSIPMLNTAAGTNFGYMFYNCQSLSSIPLLNTAAGTNFGYMFYNCQSLSSIPLLNTTAGTSFNYMFYSCPSLTSIPLLNTAAGLGFNYMFSSCTSITSIPLLNTAAGTSFNSMFSSCPALTSIPLLNTAAGTNFGYMFSNCTSLTSIPLLNTASGTNFINMFYSCLSLTSVPLLNTAAGTSFNSMFSSCTSLTSIPMLNTAAGTNFSYMFSSCTSLTSIPLLNTAAGTSFSNMFSGCTSLTLGSLSNTKVAISYANCNLSATSLNDIYTNLYGAVTSKTITVTGNWGTATDNPSIATAKGWTVTG
jgi:hypothetical protein